MNTEEQIQTAEALVSQGNLEEAEPLYRELCRMDHLTVLQRGLALFGLGTCRFLNNAHADAASLLRESWELMLAGTSMGDPLVIRTMVLLSRALIAVGDLATGMDIGRNALASLEAQHGPESEQAATAAFFLSAGAYRLGHLAESEDMIRQAMAGWERVHGPESLQVASCLDTLARLREDTGEMEDSEQFLRRSLAIKSASLGEHAATATTQGQLGLILARRSKWQEAADNLAASLQTLRKLEAANEPIGDTEALRAMLDQCRSMLEKESDDGKAALD